MNFIKYKYSGIFLILLMTFVFNSVKAVSIFKIAKIQAAGTITLKAGKTVQTDIIKWKAVPYYIDETSNVLTRSTDTVYTTGDNASFNLQKTSGKYSYYKIFAYEGSNSDSNEVQVFIPGVVQKYLYTNPAISKYSIPVWIVIPNKYSASSKYVMTMCGINRLASNIATYWVPFANTNNYIITAPEFNSKDWPSNDYILGKMFTGSFDSGSLNPKETWTFNIVQQIHKQLVSLCGLTDSTYELWGHSAGGQFVHRLAFFLPDENISRYIAANSGWYSCPDMNVAFPWGSKNSLLQLTNNDQVSFTQKRLVIMRGTADTIRDSELNIDPNSDAQGLNRYSRAAYFYNTGVKINSALKWSLVDVLNVGHEDQKMAVAGGNYIAANPIMAVKVYKEIAETFKICNYPNPFNPSTKITISLKKAEQVNLSVYNILGQLVKCIANQFMNSGEHTYEFNARDLSSGIYLCRATGENINSSLKIQLLK